MFLGGSGAEYAHLSTLFQQVGEYASENSNYFNQKQKNGHTDYTTSFQTILNVLDPLQISLEVVTNCCGKFDISPTCKGMCNVYIVCSDLGRKECDHTRKY